MAQTLIEVFNQRQNLKTSLTEVHKLLKLYLIFPTTASSGCKFPALKHIKTYFRNSMTQQRLNNCSVFHIHKEITDPLNLNSIAKEFTQANERQIRLLSSDILILLKLTYML